MRLHRVSVQNVRLERFSNGRFNCKVLEWQIGHHHSTGWGAHEEKGTGRRGRVEGEGLVPRSDPITIK